MNVMCFVLSLAAVITWLAQFFMRLRKNVLIREDIANGGWNSEGEATMGYSFWLVFIASIGKAEQQSSLDMTDFSSVMKLQSIPKKELQGFYPERLPIALPSHFGWLTEYLSWTDRNLVTLFLELTVY